MSFHPLSVSAWAKVDFSPSWHDTLEPHRDTATGQERTHHGKPKRVAPVRYWRLT
jgi:hypothetical protein